MEHAAEGRCHAANVFDQIWPHLDRYLLSVIIARWFLILLLLKNKIYFYTLFCHYTSCDGQTSIKSRAVNMSSNQAKIVMHEVAGNGLFKSLNRKRRVGFSLLINTSGSSRETSDVRQSNLTNSVSSYLVDHCESACQTFLLLLHREKNTKLRRRSYLRYSCWLRLDRKQCIEASYD